MTVVLLFCMLTLVAFAAWSAHRHLEVLAWDRELDAAFGAGERRDIARHRVL